ncbi:MAG: type I polyketide synthase [Halopseudomonas sp.]
MNKRIAIIGTAFRLPGTTQATFWEDLLAQKDLVTEVDDARWSKAAYLHPNKGHPGTSHTFAAGSVGDISGFDANFFGISPREASAMDPQQRMLLELTWEAMENAGAAPSSLRGSDCGVFIGISSTDNAYRIADDLATVAASSGTGNALSIAANRISYVFDLHGPSIAMDTACSSSLVAFHQACQSIRSGEITQAITGGVSLHLHPYGFITFSKATMLSEAGRCQVFDEAGDGYVRSEGGGVFLLKDYDQAVADGDPILAVVAGSAINTDGSKAGLTIPNPVIQSELLTRVYQQAGISPDQIDYLEAHGTGTSVGDPIESRAIGEALGQPRQTPLPIGSVKSNLGHLEAASGVAGLSKALCSLQNRCVPATISMKNPNPKILFDDWNIRVVTEAYPLKKEGVLTVGVNSFGFGGANAHVILQSHEDAPHQRPEQQDSGLVPLFISGADEDALKAAAADLAVQLEQNPEPSLYDIAYSARYRREQHRCGAVLLASSADQARQKLVDFVELEQASANNSVVDIVSGQRLIEAIGPVFVYSGNGCQWETMGKRLLGSSEVFRTAVEAVDGYFQSLADFSLIDELQGNNGSERFVLTEIAQPALFAIQVGVTELLRGQGVMPTAVTGHSVGEVAAAWACGALSLEDAVKVIYHRSRHQGLTQGLGEMTAAGLGGEAMQSLLDEPRFDGLSLAGINSSRGTTLAGDPEQLTLIEAELEQRKVFFKRLDLDYAFHSPTMDSIEAGLRDDLADLQPQSAAIPFISTVTGAALEGSTLDGEYWWHNIRKPVLFQSAVEGLLDQRYNVFIEVGGHPVLRSYLNDSLRDAGHEGVVLTTLARNQDDQQLLLNTVMSTWLAGAATDLSQWFPVTGQFVSLPGYPWQRQALELPVSSESYGFLARQFVHPLLGYRLPQHPLTWEGLLDTARYPWLADHRVGDGIVFPGAGFAELVLAAANEWQSEQGVTEIEALEIQAPLLLTEQQSKVVRVAIKAEDGRLTISSRNHSTSDQWAEHIRARIMQQPTGLALRSSLDAIPTRTPDFTREQHSAMTRSIGLNYGPAFSTISHGWVDGDVALGEFDAEELLANDIADFYLHPALLDCAFQLAFPLLKEALSQHQGLAYIPTRMERINLRNGAKLPRYAQARILRRAPHSITAEFALYDAEGECVARIEQVRFKAIRLQKNHAHHLSYLDYHLTPVPRGRRAESVSIDSALLTQALAQIGQRWHSETTADRYAEEVEPLLDSFEAAVVRTTLSSLADESGRLPRADVEQLAEQTPAVTQLLNHLLQQGEAQGVLLADELGWQLAADDEAITADLIWNMLARDYPEYFSLILPAGRAGYHLEAIVRGQSDTDVLGVGPELYVALITRIHGDDGAQVLALALSELIDSHVQQLAPGQRLKVLETGVTSPWLAEQLSGLIDNRLCDLSFAAESSTLLEQAAQLQHRFPLLSVQPLQQQSDNKQHLVLVNLNGCSLTQGRQLLMQLNDQLAPDATLIFVGQHRAAWMDLVLGVEPQWWSDEAEENYVSPPATAVQWLGLLQEQGLVDSQVHNLGRNDEVGSYLLTARAPSLAVEDVVEQSLAAQRWLLISSDTSASQTLADQLESALTAVGQGVDIVTSPDPSALESLLQQNGYSHLLHLADIGESDCLASQTRRCAMATALFNSCEKLAIAPDYWLLTAGVAETLSHDQSSLVSQSGLAGAVPADAVLWGFGRTLMNEASSLTVRLLDLPATLTGEKLIPSLVEELLAPGEENELVIAADGARYAPRLRVEAAPQSVVEGRLSVEESTVRLGFALPGQLRNLRWEHAPCLAPSDDEIEVEVRATGLNFRDVMYTLGLLSDEAIENGFAGPTLGLEFAGTVTRIGSSISEFKVGDSVVGFGPASFSSKVLTRTNAVTAIPAQIGFEAAATIPCTFFTVYYALHYLARLQPGEKVLIHGAAGGVGIAAIQVAQWLGAEVYATAGSEEKRDFLRLMGVEHIYDSRALSFAEEILAESGDGRGVDVVLNSLAGEAINRNLQVLKPMGRFLELGKRDFYENTHIGLRPFRNNISYFGIDSDQVMQECPELTRRLFTEMMELFNQGVLHPLPYTRFDANHIEESFRYMQQAKQIGKVVVTYEQGIRNTVAVTAPSERAALQLDADASYLVTGGLGGFGLRTAQWLADKGARQLILISRSGPVSAEAQAGVEALQRAGVKVHAAACDVTDKNALQQLLLECRQQLGPLKGVVHAATVIDDSLVRNQSSEQIERVLAPKILGAQHLHELTRDDELELFVLFSSATTLLGNPGQSSYVAANHWLEALAAHRRLLGLSVTCARWGAIDDVGFLARNEKIKEALQGRMGGDALSSAVALDALEQMILANSTTLGVMELEWSALQRFLPTADSPKFREIALAADEADSGDDSLLDIEQMLAELSDAELSETVSEMLAHELSRILLIPADKIDLNRSVYDIGLDSLMGVELMVAIEARFGVNIPVMVLSEAPTLVKLADYLIGQLKGDEGEQAAAPDQLQQVIKQHGVDDEGRKQLEALSDQLQSDSQNNRMIH